MSEKSALRLIPGKDAIFEYQVSPPKSYKAKSYVDYQGLIYKALVDTSTTFVVSEWELVNDLRDIRVNNIKDRNSLTGSTPTSGTTGIKIPIIDNANVLVLNAAGDPQVAANKFARYNYNKTNNSWLLLQISTGSTSSNVSNYNLLSNRPTILSGVTITQGAGISVSGGVMTGAIPSARGTATIAHADTSSQVNLLGTGRTYIQQLKFDTYGHVTGGTTSPWTHPDTSSQASVIGTGYTYIRGVSVDGDGHVTNLATSTWVHPDTSSQGDSNNAGNTFIQSIQLDGAGHVIGINTGVAAGGGGGGYYVRVNGDSGGVLSVTSGGTITVSGGTNISTVRTGGALTPGIRINVNPSGLVGQLQYNGGGVGLAASTNLVFSAGTNTLRTTNLLLGGTPVSGTTSDQILTRNPTTGTIQRIAIGSIGSVVAALPLNGIQYRTAAGFGATSGFTFTPSSIALTMGVRTGTTGSYSASFGFNNSASGAYSFAANYYNTASGINSAAFGALNKATNSQAFVIGASSIASGLYSLAHGNTVIASGTSAFSTGTNNIAGGDYSQSLGHRSKTTGIASFAGGYSAVGTKEVLSTARAAFNFSENDNSQTVGHGALAFNSAILGGVNHNIASGNIRAAIIGGTGIKLTGSSYIDFVAVPSLAIFTTPSAGGSNDILSWDATSKKIGKITQASLKTSAAGSNSYVQFRDNSGNFGASSALSFATGTSTLVTTNATVSNTLTLSGTPTGTTLDWILTRETSVGIVRKRTLADIIGGGNGVILYKSTNGFGSTSEFKFESIERGLTLGSRSGSTGQYSLVIGNANLASNNHALAIGTITFASGANSIATGVNTRATGTNAATFGAGTFADGYGALAEGGFTRARGLHSHAEGYYTTGDTQYSHSEGYYTNSNGLATHTGGIGVSISKAVLATGNGAFNHSINTNSQTVGHGALAPSSAILGGEDHNIAVGNTRAVIVGGTGIKLTGTTYIDYTAVSNLAIFATPSAGGSSDVLTWNATTKKIGKITQISLKNVGGSDTQIQYNNAGVISGHTQYIFNQTARAVTLGTRTGSTGTNSMTIGSSNSANATGSLTVGANNSYAGLYGLVVGFANRISPGNWSIAVGQENSMIGSSSANAIFGSFNTISGTSSLAMGQGAKIIGNYSFAGGYGDITTGKEILVRNNYGFNFSYNSPAQTAGHGAIAISSTILGGQDHNIAAGNTRAAIIGGNGIKLTGSTYADHVAVPSLAIFTTPSAGSGSDELLTWNSSNKKVGKISQSGLLQTVEVTISSAEVLTLNSSPKQIIAAPGANKMIVPVSLSASIDYNSIQYTSNTLLQFRAGTTNLTSAAGALLGSTADGLYIWQASPGSVVAPNQNLNLWVAAGNPANGNSPIKVYVTYRIVDL